MFSPAESYETLSAVKGLFAEHETEEQVIDRSPGDHELRAQTFVVSLALSQVLGEACTLRMRRPLGTDARWLASLEYFRAGNTLASVADNWITFYGDAEPMLNNIAPEVTPQDVLADIAAASSAKT